MSEFTRQAHPDAAHRERLSREIPGLSPRQVQVWFQNRSAPPWHRHTRILIHDLRRAKLKRLTTDDRERMLKSRALPEDFDMTQALHSPYGGQPGLGTPVASPITYFPPYHENSMIRPLVAEGPRRHNEDEHVTSPLSIPSTYTNFFTPPASSTTSEALSPISTTSDRTHFATMHNSLNTSPRTNNPFGRSTSFSTYQHAGAQIPRLQIHDRNNRSRAESLASPLRTSMSYTVAPMDHSSSAMPPPYDSRRHPDRMVVGNEHASAPPFANHTDCKHQTKYSP